MTISYKSQGTLEATRFEKIHSVIFKESKEASKIVANEIADLIRKKQKENKNCVLGLATGSSPISVYNELGEEPVAKPRTQFLFSFCFFLIRYAISLATIFDASLDSLKITL